MPRHRKSIAAGSVDPTVRMVRADLSPRLFWPQVLGTGREPVEVRMRPLGSAEVCHPRHDLMRAADPGAVPRHGDGDRMDALVIFDFFRSSHSTMSPRTTVRLNQVLRVLPVTFGDLRVRAFSRALGMRGSCAEHGERTHDR